MVSSKTQKRKTSPDPQAIEIARWLHEKSGSLKTYLFGSRARGDHRPDSDIDLLIIGDSAEDEEWTEAIRDQGRAFQNDHLKQASGIDVLYMSVQKFEEGRHLINNLAWTIAREGIDIMADERLGYNYKPQDEENELQEEATQYTDEYDNTEQVDYFTDWKDVDARKTDATGYANSTKLWLEIGTQFLDQVDDKSFGHTAQQALEKAYKALLGANG